MDGWHKPDEGGRVGHRCDEEWQDRTEGGKAERDPEESAIGHTNSEVKAQVLTNVLFNFGEGKHLLILPFRFAAFSYSGWLKFSQEENYELGLFALDKFPDLHKIKTNVRSF